MQHGVGPAMGAVAGGVGGMLECRWTLFPPLGSVLLRNGAILDSGDMMRLCRGCSNASYYCPPQEPSEPTMALYLS